MNATALVAEAAVARLEAVAHLVDFLNRLSSSIPTASASAAFDSSTSLATTSAAVRYCCESLAWASRGLMTGPSTLATAARARAIHC